MSDRLPIIERFELETLDDVLQVAADAEIPSVGIVVAGALSPDANVYVDGELRGTYVDTDVEAEMYVSHVTGDKRTIYGTRRVRGQRVLK